MKATPASCIDIKNNSFREHLCLVGYNLVGADLVTTNNINMNSTCITFFFCASRSTSHQFNHAPPNHTLLASTESRAGRPFGQDRFLFVVYGEVNAALVVARSRITGAGSVTSGLPASPRSKF